MGNRANVIFHDPHTGAISPAVYLHWNGGPESVYAFLDEMDRRRVCRDVSYEAARFIHIVGDFFDQDKAGGLSLGVTNGPSEITEEALRPYSEDDNGAYVVSRFSTAGEPPRTVRRFKRWGRECGTAWVQKEREAAYATSYPLPYKGIPGLFQALRPITGE